MRESQKQKKVSKILLTSMKEDLWGGDNPSHDNAIF